MDAKPRLHAHTKDQWNEVHRDQELDAFMAHARNVPHADPEPVVHEL
jgi:hypothetical protein